MYFKKDHWLLEFLYLTIAFYGRGVIHLLPHMPINHGVVLVGNDPENGYLIKNSWGTWGNSGYAWISHSSSQICSYAFYVKVWGNSNAQCWKHDNDRLLSHLRIRYEFNIAWKFLSNLDKLFHRILLPAIHTGNYLIFNHLWLPLNEWISWTQCLRVS